MSAHPSAPPNPPLADRPAAGGRPSTEEMTARLKKYLQPIEYGTWRDPPEAVAKVKAG